MSKFFTSVLKLVKSSESKSPESETGAADDLLQVDHDRAQLTLQLEQPRPQMASGSSSSSVTLGFDKILSPELSGGSLYRETAREVVEGALLGYHGTVITLAGSGSSSQAKSEALWSGKGREGMIQRAARQMFRCLRKSRKSKSKSMASNLVILCSFVMLMEEEARDLLYDFKKADIRSSDENDGTYLPPKLDMVNGRLTGVSQCPLTTSKEVAAILKSGTEMKEKILRVLYTADSNRLQSHHTVFTLTVEFSQFGSMNAPVSGNLLFVDLAASDFLTRRQKYMRGDEIDKEMKSLFTFANVVESLTRNVSQLDAVRGVESAFTPTVELPHVPTLQNENIHNGSVLTQLIRDSLGGNCKTLLVTFADAHRPTSRSPELLETLKLASRARMIQNTPNKRDLAEKALMSAYLRGLEEMYGKGVREEEQQPQPVLHNPTSPTSGKGWLPMVEEGGVTTVGKSQSSLQSDDIDTAYDEMIDATKGEERQKNVELAATALVAAALEDKEDEEDEEEEESGSENEDDRDGDNSAESSAASHSSNSGMRAIENSAAAKSRDKRKRKESVLILQDKQQNVTLEVLVAMLQDPDEGAPRPSREQLENVRIKKDAGGIFSGSAITHWLLNHISGVRSESDAQLLGQLLLESGLIFHSEGSRVFASAESLFYHTKYARTNQKSLSFDEIQSLLKKNLQAEEVDHDSDHDLEVKVPAHQLSYPMPQLILRPTVQLRGGEDPLGPESAPTFGAGDMEVKDIEGAEEGGVGSPTAAAAPEGGEAEGGEMATTTAPKEEWMRSPSGETNEEGEELQGEYEEDEVTADPNTAPLERIPSLHTLETTENYPHPLHMAAAIGKSPGVLRELIMMFGVNKLDNSCRTPLMFAALGNNKSSTCSTLLRCSAEVDLQDSSGLTALHVACYHGSRSAASVLLGNGASIATTDKLGHTALHWSMVPHDTGCLELLTQRSLHPDLLNHTDRSGLTVMHWSIFYNHPQHLAMFLKRYNRAGKIELTRLDAEGRTLATYAIEKKSPSCLKVLLEASPSLLTLADHQSILPIHHASAQSSPDSLNVLLNFKPSKRSSIQAKVDLWARDQLQQTCLHYSVAYNRLEVARVLVARGAEISVKDSEGKSPVDYATQLSEGKEEMLEALRGEQSLAGPVEPNTSTPKETRQRSKFCNLL